MKPSPFWPGRLSHHLSAPQTSLYYNLEVAATRYPDKTAIHYYGTAISYAQLRREVDALAGYLQRRCGVTRGDRVALYMQNSPQFVVSFYAVLRADAVVVPVNPMSLAAELRHIVEDSGANAILVADELYANAAPLFGSGISHAVVARYAEYLTAATDLPLPTILSDPPNSPLDQAPPPVIHAGTLARWRDALLADEPPAPHLAAPADLAIIPYTSGTTAAPKGCMHTHRTAMHVVAASAQWCQLSPESVVLCTVPMFHVTGMQQCMNPALLTGATMVVMTRWDPRCAAELIERQHVSMWIAISTMMVDFMSQPELARFDLHSLALLGGGGAAMPKALADQIQTQLAIPYMEGYGLSETIAATHINPPERCKRQCLGIPIQDTVSFVIDPLTLTPVEPGRQGEIVTCGPQVFEGYWGRPDATRDAFVEIDGQRYLRTGDLGYVDEDGYFFMIDRLKRIINVSGYKVSPAEVETLLFEHPAIQEACVIAARDARSGETVKAFVVLRAGHDASAEQIIAWAHTRMSAYKAPRIVEFVESLPRSGSGKVQWRVLQQQDLERAS
jgi:fatty-acyl-CoA synthase